MNKYFLNWIGTTHPHKFLQLKIERNQRQCSRTTNFPEFHWLFYPYLKSNSFYTTLSDYCFLISLSFLFLLQTQAMASLNNLGQRLNSSQNLEKTNEPYGIIFLSIHPSGINISMLSAYALAPLPNKEQPSAPSNDTGRGQLGMGEMMQRWLDQLSSNTKLPGYCTRLSFLYFVRERRLLVSVTDIFSKTNPAFIFFIQEMDSNYTSGL